MHPRLARLDALAAALARAGDVVAVVGVGSAGTEHDRFDDHSDIDFFVVVGDPSATSRYLGDVEWLTAMGTLVYSFVNDANGRKALFDDGLFVEYAIFTTTELAVVPYTGGRIVYQRPDLDIDVETGVGPAGASFDTIEFHLNETLTNLFVGLHRELRGEHLSAARFIQVFAVDHILALARLAQADEATVRDRFDPTRRVEFTYPGLVAQLDATMPGYSHNADAARAVLGWLSARYDLDVFMTAQLRTLIDRAVCSRPQVG